MNSQLWSGINNERHSNMGFSVGITTGFNGKTIFFSLIDAFFIVDLGSEDSLDVAN